MWSCRFDGTRTSGTHPASAMDAIMCVVVSTFTSECSTSTVSQSNPARARNRAAVMLPSESHVPTLGLPAFRSFLTGLVRMSSLRDWWRVLC